VLYAKCRIGDATAQLETAERWLASHAQDATLLYALGMLCERESLWGKAQTYLEASLALDDQWRTRGAGRAPREARAQRARQHAPRGGAEALVEQQQLVRTSLAGIRDYP
jgi:HemY protein